MVFLTDKNDQKCSTTKHSEQGEHSAAVLSELAKGGGSFAVRVKF